MTARALLIGASGSNLTGVGTDLDAMSELLTDRGFVIDRIQDAAATRAAVLAAYQRLIEATDADDSSLVYYAGHGGRVLHNPLNGALPDKAAPTAYQFICPTDIEESDIGDFRGITALELSALQTELTDRTENVTTILDCCHSARMSRDPDLVPRARVHDMYADVTAHHASLDPGVLERAAHDAAGNQRAVRLVACAAEELAMEYTDPNGRRRGLFTHALVEVLTAATALPLSWATLLESVRQRVRATTVWQRPEAEGPSRRIAFSTDVAPAGVLPVTRLADDQVSLPGGRLAGIEIGDRFALLPACSIHVTDVDRIGEATVISSEATHATARVDLAEADADLPESVAALQVTRTLPRLPVEVAGTGTRAAALREAIGGSRFVRVSEPSDGASVLTVTVEGDLVALYDRTGPLLHPRSISASAGIAELTTDLDRLARAAALRSLANAPTPSLDLTFEVDVGVVEDGRPLKLAGGGAVFVGQHLYARLCNRSTRPLWFHLFDIGAAGRITLVTNSDPSGIRLEKDQERWVGRLENGDLVGLKLGWPDVPADAPRQETLIVVASTEPQDLTVLEQEGLQGAARGGTALQQWFAQLGDGGRRDLATESTLASEPVWSIRPIDLLLHPRADERTAFPGDSGFLIDERPDPSLRLGAPRGAASATLAIRIRELVVHRNRALRNADIRLDTLVVTGPPAGADTTAAPPAPVFQSRTETFPRARDGEQLSLDRMLIYHGEVRDYLDIAIWVSRDRAGALQLTDLLAQSLNAAGTKEALGVVAGLAIAAPHAAAAAAAAATATLVDVAYRILSVTLSDSIGLYRTTLLPMENFGIGRHPTDGLRRAQDFSFGYEVVDPN
jgi:hypothetical protein